MAAVTEMAKLVGERDRFKPVFHDGGAAMANVTLATDALGQDGRWTLLKEGEPHGLAPPPRLNPLARLLPRHRDRRANDSSRQRY